MNIDGQEAEGMSWWRVQFHTDGSIKNVDETEYVTAPGRVVSYVYVQANDKASACSAAKKWWDKRVAIRKKADAKSRHSRIALGLCSKPGCGRKPREGKKTCQECADRASSLSRESLESRASGVPDRRLSDKTPEQRMEDFRADQKVRRCDTTWLALLKKFDELGPVSFREWLLSHVPSVADAQEAAQ